MKKKAIYRKKFIRALKSLIKEIDILPAPTLVDVYKRIRARSLCLDPKLPHDRLLFSNENK
jgi:hypothetical protein